MKREMKETKKFQEQNNNKKPETPSSLFRILVSYSCFVFLHDFTPKWYFFFSSLYSLCVVHQRQQSLRKQLEKQLRKQLRKLLWQETHGRRLRLRMRPVLLFKFKQLLKSSRSVQVRETYFDTSFAGLTSLGIQRSLLITNFFSRQTTATLRCGFFLLIKSC